MASTPYIPPAKLRALQAKITDKSSEDYQKLTWEALKKSLNGLINKVNVQNIKQIVPEIFEENLIRGQGLLCRSLMKAQNASPPYTPIFTTVVAVINTKFPMIGELLINRLLSQFRRGYKRSDKQVCLSTSLFLAHLVNQRVANEVIALQILMLLLERPSDDSVEVAVGFMRQVGYFLLSENPKACHAVFERFRAILHEGAIEKRTQYMVEVLFQLRKEKFKESGLNEDLDIVEEDEQITHMVGLDDELETKEELNVFHFDEKFVDHELEYEKMKREILGEESSGEESGSEGTSDEDEDVVEEERALQIQDQTNTNLVNLRRAIYLTIMSSLNFEECAHKLLKLDLPTGQEIELCNIIIECCSQERTYVSFYGLLVERFCKIAPVWAEAFSKAFEETYTTIHRYETNRIRNVAKLFAHALSMDGLSWQCLALIRLTEADTTSSSRIFCKFLFNEMASTLGIKTFAERLKDDIVVEVETGKGIVTRGVFDGLFPMDTPRNTRFAINYFTSIGLGVLTEGMREALKKQQEEAESESDSGSESDVDSSDVDERGRSRSRTPPKQLKNRGPSASPISAASSSPGWVGRRNISRERRSPSPKYRRERTTSRTPRSYRLRSNSRTPPRLRERVTSRSPPSYRGRSKSRTPPRLRERATSRSPASYRGRSKSRTPPRLRERATSRSPPSYRRRSKSRTPPRLRERATSRSPASYRRRSISRTPPRRRYSPSLSKRRTPPRRRYSRSPRRREVSSPRYSRRRSYSRSPRGNRSISRSPRRGRYRSRSPPRSRYDSRR